MVDYIFRYDVAAVLICIAVMLSYFRENRIRTKISEAFTALTWQCLVSSLFDILSIFLLKYITPSTVWLNYIVNIIYYFFFNAMPLCFYFCLYFLSERNAPMPRKQYWTFFGIYLGFSVLLF